jgi:hypothetical protein
MKNRYLISLLIIASLTTNAYAGKVLSISAEIGKDDSVEMKYMRLEEGNPTFLLPGNYLLRITDPAGGVVYNTSLDVRFVLYADPPIATNRTRLFLRIPYEVRMSNLAFYNGDRRIYSAPISLCDKDGVCTPGPEDCPLDKADGVCIKEKDRVCDPDCIKDADPDCKIDLPPIYVFAPMVLLFILFAALIVYVLNRKRREQF